MQLYVGVTDKNWYSQLMATKANEVNFWTPGTASFKALNENELFLFKLHAPDNYIVGGGFFVKYSELPTFLAWDAFGENNGVKSLDELNRRIAKYRARCDIEANPMIGCIILTDCFWFEEDEWIPIPSDWSSSIVKGKRYYDSNPVGLRLFNDIEARLQGGKTIVSQKEETSTPRTVLVTTKHRLGQAAFRTVVSEAYNFRCAITGEKTLPVLEAAHIKSFSSDGPNKVNNGILLKSDFHTLFDRGYITITPEFRIEVNDRLHLDFGNGKDYYKHQGEKLLVLPGDASKYPSAEYLQWHNDNVYLHA